MFEALAQATYTYSTNLSGDEKTGLAAVLAIIGGLLFIIVPLIIFQIVCMWKVFEKAGVEGWKSIIPVYNMWVLAEIVGKPGWWALVSLGGVIPVLGFVASIAAFILYIIIYIELAKSFGKEPVFSLLLIFLPFVAFAMLAFGKAQYVGPGGVVQSKSAAKKA